MTDSEAAAWTRGHAVGERELKAAEKRWQVERAELKAEIERLCHNNRVLTDAVWKACGDEESAVHDTIASQGDLK
jgi:hypothetical protein